MTTSYALKHDDNYAVRFLHFRSSPYNGMSKKRTHDNQVDTSFGGVTVAYNPMLMVRKNGTVGVFVEIGSARCSGLDRYVKKTGRDIAIKNLQNQTNNFYNMIYLGEGATIEDMVKLNAPRIPLIVNGLCDSYVDERTFNLRAAVSLALGFNF